MLKGVDPLIGPDLLMVLAAMGHGDELVIADANFPSATIAKGSVHGQVLRIACGAPRAVQAVLSVMPVDTYEAHPVHSMQVVGDAHATPEVVSDAAPLFAAEQVSITALERFEFYERARNAFAVVATAEMRQYGNFIIRKGVITTHANPA
ncbi:MAG: RbsD/FucU family protein [Burkholderiaceae bacterium]